MKSENIVVLGAGIAGISAAYHLKQQNKQVKVFEKNNDHGGLCGGFFVDSIKGKFWFDNAVHLSFAKDESVRKAFFSSTKHYIHIPKPLNYYNGVWVKHPAQNNLYALPLDIKLKAIKDMLQNTYENIKVENFEQWLKAQYGEFFSEEFAMKYTSKYWTLDAKDLNTNPMFVGSRFYKPSIDEILTGAMSENTPVTYYAKEMYYLIKGGYKAFLEGMVKEIDIAYQKEVTVIDNEKKIIYFSDETRVKYEKLISTLPLPLLVKILKNTPQDILKSSKHLHATSVALVSLGFDKEIPEQLWYYVYDGDKLFARFYSPSVKSVCNAPKNCSSIQVEIYFSDFKSLEKMSNNSSNLADFFIKHVKEKLLQMKFCNEKDIICEDFRIIPYANIIFNHGMEEHRDKILKYIKDCGILTCGRFGEWDYLWSDQSFLSGKNAANNLS
ncbi:protoporphyrinogen/coproporphyrinogen oxidase [Campylobacter coli]|uniref:protoporphyrinogen/coproporphyrinogen oxidase n=1 Tax=Campylobacter coli TaxID=195 RepID=UPI00285C957D|nr:FAD-dependent oxidoreductase [Campylobacter coli]BEK49247.1 NAD(P)/FAD-dependent oxidoreductase [Campylobacter coli]HDV6395151.1 FAD-dependent oxidoreductase [Campylobacter coli]